MYIICLFTVLYQWYKLQIKALSLTQFKHFYHGVNIQSVSSFDDGCQPRLILKPGINPNIWNTFIQIFR